MPPEDDFDGTPRVQSVEDFPVEESQIMNNLFYIDPNSQKKPSHFKTKVGEVYHRKMNYTCIGQSSANGRVIADLLDFVQPSSEV